MTIPMTFTSVLENIARSPIATKIGEKLTTAKSISLSGLSRLGKGLISTHLCQQQAKPLLIVTATRSNPMGFTTPINVMTRLSITP
jgi:transcription-repair coupling factor (superfamily II helicase)